MALFMGIMSIVPANGQRHFYNRVEFGGGNIWTYMGMIGTSIIINQMVRRPLTEATMRFAVPSSEFGNLNGYQGFYDWNSERFINDEEYASGDDGYAKFGKRNLLSNIIVGDKMGYLTDRLGLTNFCFYGAAYYNLQQFKLMKNYDDYNNLSTQRLQLGGGLMVILGSIESKNRFIFDGGVRYNLPLAFSGENISGSVDDIMNKGLTSHYMFKWSHNNSTAVGITVDVMHYNMFKDESLCGNKSKLLEFGLTLSLMFQ